MGKKLIFNPETLSFEYSKFSIKRFLRYTLSHIIATITFGGILGYMLFTSSISPELKNLKNENSNLIANFQDLDHKTDIQIGRMKNLEDRDDNVYRSVLGLNPIPKSTRLLGYGGSNKFSNLDYLDNGGLVKKVAMKTLSLDNREKLEVESYDKIIHLVKNRSRMLNSIPSICPISNKDLRRIGSGFGYRMHPILHVIKFHTGVDLVADRGKPVYATGDGIVVRADASSGGYGNCIRINHGYTYLTMYAHLSKILVVPGQMVKRGQLIGLVGTTGRSTGPHLHYEVRINNTPVNPVNFFYNDINEKQYEMLIRQAAAGESVEPL
jgi:murein DD-endopeptidase MepM/ murein hydrolase activator NlpD